MALLAKLPGLGPRSARRAALALLKRRDQLLIPLTAAMRDAAEQVLLVLVGGDDLDAVLVEPGRQQAADDAVRVLDRGKDADADGRIDCLVAHVCLTVRPGELAG